MKFRTKGFTSLLLTCLFATAAFSGIILYMTPRGRVANWTGWTMMGLDKHSWGAMHINACLLFLLVALLHLFFNLKVFWGYIKKRSSGFNLKAEMALALLVTTVVIAGTLYKVPPLSSTMTLNERIKNYWEEATPSGPAPHAEEFTLTRFANTVGLTIDDIETALGEEGYTVNDKTSTIGFVAEENEITPNQVFIAIRKHYPEINIGMGAGRGQGMGRGRGGQGAGGGVGGGYSADAKGECSANASQGNGPSGEHPQKEGSEFAGPGNGEGRGMGRGPGGGMGMGRGLGGGMGRGWGRAHQDGEGPQHGAEKPQNEDSESDKVSE
jgi:hypothetical protein